MQAAHAGVDALVRSRTVDAADRVRSTPERRHIATLASPDSSATGRARLQRSQANAGAGSGVEIREEARFTVADRIVRARFAETGGTPAAKSAGIAVLYERFNVSLSRRKSRFTRSLPSRTRNASLVEGVVEQLRGVLVDRAAKAFVDATNPVTVLAEGSEAGYVSGYESANTSVTASASFAA